MTQTEAQEQHEEAESSGTYSKEVLFDKKKYQKIISKNMKIGADEKFRKTFLDILKHKNIKYLGNNIQEKPTSAEIATAQVE